MDQREVSAAYSKLAKEVRVRLLLQLSHKLTVVARDTYFQGKVHDPDKLIGINEFQHRLLRIALDLVDGQAIRTDEEIGEYLLVGFAELGATQMLAEAIGN